MPTGVERNLQTIVEYMYGRKLQVEEPLWDNIYEQNLFVSHTGGILCQ
jgi:hypothetical protein